MESTKFVKNQLQFCKKGKTRYYFYLDGAVWTNERIYKLSMKPTGEKITKNFANKTATVASAHNSALKT